MAQDPGGTHGPARRLWPQLTDPLGKATASYPGRHASWRATVLGDPTNCVSTRSAQARSGPPARSAVPPRLDRETGSTIADNAQSVVDDVTRTRNHPPWFPAKISSLGRTILPMTEQSPRGSRSMSMCGRHEDCRQSRTAPIGDGAWSNRAFTVAPVTRAMTRGMKNPVSRKGGAGGKRPVTAKCSMLPSLTTLSTDR